MKKRLTRQQGGRKRTWKTQQPLKGKQVKRHGKMNVPGIQIEPKEPAKKFQMEINPSKGQLKSTLGRAKHHGMHNVFSSTSKAAVKEMGGERPKERRSESFEIPDFKKNKVDPGAHRFWGWWCGARGTDNDLKHSNSTLKGWAYC